MYELSTEVTENMIKHKGNLVANYYSGIIQWIECKFHEITCNLVKLDAIWWIICLKFVPLPGPGKFADNKTDVLICFLLPSFCCLLLNILAGA